MPTTMRDPNWFIGIQIPSTGWFDQLVPAAPSGLRRFHPDDLHATVAFLGPVDERRAYAGWNALRWNLAPCTACLGAVVPMGSTHRYSALAVELINTNNAIEDAIKHCRETVCVAAGALPDRRPPRAHVTIARPSQRATDKERSDGLRWAARLDFHEHNVILNTIALYTWADSRHLRQFKIVARSNFPQSIGDPQR